MGGSYFDVHGQPLRQYDRTNRREFSTEDGGNIFFSFTRLRVDILRVRPR